MTFCAVAALRFLGYQHGVPTEHNNPDSLMALEKSSSTVFDPKRTIEWLVNRLTTEIYEEDFDDTDEGRTFTDSFSPSALNGNTGASFEKIRSMTSQQRYAGRTGLDADAFLEYRTRPLGWAGFAGRCNKVADTCYAFWAGGSLKVSPLITPFVL